MGAEVSNLVVGSLTEPALRGLLRLENMTHDSPHDALFKKIFANPEHARGPLYSLMPQVWRDALNWGTLEPSRGSFVSPELKSRHTDLLFSVQFHDRTPALVYLLFEHQSTPDRMMPYRLLCYLVRIWESWRGKHPDAQTLPVILPVVLYHGRVTWNVATSLHELLDVPGALLNEVRDYVPQLSLLLDDLTGVTDEALRERAVVSAFSAAAVATFVCLKYSRSPEDIIAVFRRWTDILVQVAMAPNGLEALELLMRYILLVDETVEPKHLQTLLDDVVGATARDTMTSVGQRLIEEGIQRGERSGEKKFFLNQLRKKFANEVTAEVEQRVAQAPIDQVELWGERILFAQTIEEVWMPTPTSAQ